MGLDIRTMMVMTALLSLLLSGLLALASLHAAHLRGIRCWAFSELCIAVGLGMAYSQISAGNVWVIVMGATLIALAINLQRIGIRRFSSQPHQWRWVWISTLLVMALNIWFVVLAPDVNHRVVANSFMYGVLTLSCARALLHRVDPALRTAYWFTGGAFLLLGLVLLARSGYVLVFPHQHYGLYAHLAINPVTFFTVSMVQLALVFGLVLMMHYRIANDLQTLAARDSLTGALNRRSLEEMFGHLRALYLRSGGVMSVMMIDVDHFKRINDVHGHLVGDEVLRRLSRIIESTIRKQDYFARYGGEEFCILMPSTSESEAAIIATRLRELYAATSMGTDGDDWYSSISIGVADSTTSGFEYEPLMAAADRAMYTAKQTGRDRVVAYSQSV